MGPESWICNASILLLVEVSLRMPKKTAKEADQWVGVTDAKQRKKIQDRLAQRARSE